MNDPGLGSRFLSSPAGGMLDLETPCHGHQRTQLGHPSPSYQNHVNMMSGVENEKDSHQVRLMEVKSSTPALSLSKGKSVAPSDTMDGNGLSEEDEQEDGYGENIDGVKGKNGSPWQRMKWTENEVRLLIAVVACVGDDGVLDGAEGLKRKSVILQRKGKWKTVSKVMISKGCHVSPQQCEDKFNDLNKRYKRLNDILGRGTSCRVVENPSLMDTMPHLSAKAKDDVRKILSSKQLFYKEMCAYHSGQKIPNINDLDFQGYLLPHGKKTKDKTGSDEEEAEENYRSEDDELDNEDDNDAHVYGESAEHFPDRKRMSEDGHIWMQSSGLDDFEIEMARVVQDPLKSLSEQREWMKNQMLQLQGQKVGYDAQALELEKQRFKWRRYCRKKDRELERMTLENERMKLENERKILLLRQKELGTDFRRPEIRRDPSSIGIERLQGSSLKQNPQLTSWMKSPFVE